MMKNTNFGLNIGKTQKVFGETSWKLDPIRRHMKTMIVGITLIYNYDTGEGDLRISDDFMGNGSLFKLDVISDWAYDLENLRVDAFKEWRKEYAKLQKNNTEEIW